MHRMMIIECFRFEQENHDGDSLTNIEMVFFCLGFSFLKTFSFCTTWMYWEKMSQLSHQVWCLHLSWNEWCKKKLINNNNHTSVWFGWQWQNACFSQFKQRKADAVVIFVSPSKHNYTKHNHLGTNSFLYLFTGIKYLGVSFSFNSHSSLKKWFRTHEEIWIENRSVIQISSEWFVFSF